MRSVQRVVHVQLACAEGLVGQRPVAHLGPLLHVKPATGGVGAGELLVHVARVDVPGVVEAAAQNCRSADLRGGLDDDDARALLHGEVCRVATAGAGAEHQDVGLLVELGTRGLVGQSLRSACAQGSRTRKGGGPLQHVPTRGFKVCHQ